MPSEGAKNMLDRSEVTQATNRMAEKHGRTRRDGSAFERIMPVKKLADTSALFNKPDPKAEVPKVQNGTIDNLFNQLEEAWAQGTITDVDHVLSPVIEIVKCMANEIEELKDRVKELEGVRNPVEPMEAGESLK